MGRSIGQAFTFFAGVRVSNRLTYIPAYIKADGKRVPAKCIIPVARNSHKGHNPDGTEGRTDFFELTAWGKLADIMARSCPPGKALDVLCEPRTYKGKLFTGDGSGQQRQDAAGVPIEITKMSFNIIVAPTFGEESEKQIAQEIIEGWRPANWNVKGHPDYQLWLENLAKLQAAVWDGRSPDFGWARVVVPQGVQLDFSQAPDRSQQYQQRSQRQQSQGRPAMSGTMGAGPAMPSINAGYLGRDEARELNNMEVVVTGDALDGRSCHADGFRGGDAVV